MSMVAITIFDQFIIFNIYLTSIDTSKPHQPNSFKTRKNHLRRRHHVMPEFQAGPGLLLVFAELGEKVTEEQFHGESPLCVSPSLPACGVSTSHPSLLSSLSVLLNPGRLVRQRTHPPPNLFSPRIHHCRPFRRP
jgi:hypothetical protein